MAGMKTLACIHRTNSSLGGRLTPSNPAPYLNRVDTRVLKCQMMMIIFGISELLPVAPDHVWQDEWVPCEAHLQQRRHHRLETVPVTPRGVL